MKQPYYKTVFESSPLGISISFCSIPGGYQPPHWHEELELLYPLNGKADIMIENSVYQLPKKNVIAIECCKVHSTFTYDSSAMCLRICASKECLQHYMPDITDCQISCIPEKISDTQFAEYYKICNLFTELTCLYIYNAPSFRLEAEGLILQAIARMLRFFSSSHTPDLSSSDPLSAERIRAVIRYVEQHFQENISLQDAAAFLGISREYFCRIFKKNTGSSFLQYLDEVRLAKIYSELQSTSLPIAEIMERNGFTSQKRFNKSFKKMYGCTPSSIRKASFLPQ